MSESIAEGLSVVGLVVGFPLLLLGLMLSLEKLESWGLRDTDVERETEQVPDRDPIDDAVDRMGELTLSAPTAEVEQTPPAGTPRSGGP